MKGHRNAPMTYILVRPMQRGVLLRTKITSGPIQKPDNCIVSMGSVKDGRNLGVVILQYFEALLSTFSQEI